MNRRTYAGVLLLVVYACVRAAWQLSRVVVAPAEDERRPAIVAEYDEHRYAGLRDALPPGEVIGYVTDEPDSSEATRLYYLSQYVLAPCVLVRGEKRPLMLVDDPANQRPRPSMAGRSPLRDLGNGVRLLGRGEGR